MAVVLLLSIAYFPRVYISHEFQCFPSTSAVLSVVALNAAGLVYRESTTTQARTATSVYVYEHRGNRQLARQTIRKTATSTIQISNSMTVVNPMQRYALLNSQHFVSSGKIFTINLELLMLTVDFHDCTSCKS